MATTTSKSFNIELSRKNIVKKKILKLLHYFNVNFTDYLFCCCLKIQNGCHCKTNSFNIGPYWKMKFLETRELIEPKLYI